MNTHLLHHLYQIGKQLHVVRCLIPEPLFFFQERCIYMVLYNLHKGMTETLLCKVEPVCLQRQQGHNKAVDRGIGEGEAHCNVDLLNLLGQGVQDGLQKVLVAEDNRPSPGLPLYGEEILILQEC